MKLTSPINDKFIALCGGAILLAIVISSWVPQPCPLLRRAMIGCPAALKPYAKVPATVEEQEIARIPHQEIPSQIAYFSPKSDDTRNETSIGFLFREQNLNVHPIVFLQAKEGGQFVDLALITHPLLENLTWPATGDGHYRLYQRELTIENVNDITKNLPPAGQLAADTAAARHFNLAGEQYQNLENLSSLDGISYILTSFQPPVPNGASWKTFRQTFDLTAATPDAKGNLNFAIRIPSYAEGQSFLLGTIGVDFARADRKIN